MCQQIKRCSFHNLINSVLLCDWYTSKDILEGILDDEEPALPLKLWDRVVLATKAQPDTQETE
jgi:hypothetical protein